MPRLDVLERPAKMSSRPIGHTDATTVWNLENSNKVCLTLVRCWDDDPDLSFRRAKTQRATSLLVSLIGHGIFS
jgi:hypothetical protein